MDYGKTIASFRAKWGIDQKDLAKAIGASKASISLIERGLRRPSKNMLTKIAHYFEVTPLFLFLEVVKDNGQLKGKKAREAYQLLGPMIEDISDFMQLPSETVPVREQPRKRLNKVRKKKPPSKAKKRISL